MLCMGARDDGGGARRGGVQGHPAHLGGRLPGQLRFSLLAPVLPLYALTFGVDLAFVGVLVGSIGITKVALDIPAGVASDRIGTKRFMSLGLMTVTVSAIVSALAVNEWMLLIGLVLQGAGSAVYFTSSYLAVSRLCPVGKRGRHLGLFVSLQFLGSTSGPLVGGLFGQSFGLGTPFLVYALFAGASLAMVHFGVGSEVEGKGGRIDVRQLTSATSRTLPPSTWGWRSVNIVIATVPVFATGNLASPVELGGPDGVLLANFVTLLPAGALSDRLGRRPFMFTSLMATGLLVLLLSHGAIIVRGHRGSPWAPLGPHAYRGMGLRHFQTGRAGRLDGAVPHDGRRRLLHRASRPHHVPAGRGGRHRTGALRAGRPHSHRRQPPAAQGPGPGGQEA